MQNIPLDPSYVTYVTQLLLHGAAAVGKGVSYKRLKAVFPSLGLIGMGDMVRSRLETDSAFREEFKPAVKRGDLLPDHIVLPMAKAKWQQAATDRVSQLCLDGIPRNPNQFDDLHECGLVLPQNTLIILLDATRETCRERFKHRNDLKPDGERIDADSFENRYDIYEQDLPLMKMRWKELGMHVITIDANRPIDVFVPIVVAMAQAYWKKPAGARSTTPYPIQRPVETMTSRERVIAANLHTASAPRFAVA